MIIKQNLLEINKAWTGLNWLITGIKWRDYVNKFMNLRVSSQVGIFLTRLENISFSRRAAPCH
jgi:hypothetical protein